MPIPISAAGTNLVSNTKDFLAECKTKPVACAGRAVIAVVQVGYCAVAAGTAAFLALGTAGAVTNLVKEHLPSVASHLPSCLDVATSFVSGSSLLLTAGVAAATIGTTHSALNQACAVATKFFGTPKAKPE